MRFASYESKPAAASMLIWDQIYHTKEPSFTPAILAQHSGEQHDNSCQPA
jgi:hypothetical protein